jgi:hypothetical protein
MPAIFSFRGESGTPTTNGEAAAAAAPLPLRRSPLGGHTDRRRGRTTEWRSLWAVAYHATSIQGPVGWNNFRVESWPLFVHNVRYAILPAQRVRCTENFTYSISSCQNLLTFYACLDQANTLSRIHEGRRSKASPKPSSVSIDFFTRYIYTNNTRTPRRHICALFTNHKTTPPPAAGDAPRPLRTCLDRWKLSKHFPIRKLCTMKNKIWSAQMSTPAYVCTYSILYIYIDAAHCAHIISEQYKTGASN